jgi:putative ABC transport system permease protein
MLLQTAFTSLLANPGRSLLTILGIVIGIIAIVLVIALGQGAQNLIVSELENFGANFIIIRPGRQPDTPTDIAESILGDSIKEKDIFALRRPENAPGVVSVDPAVLVTGEATYQENIFRPMIFGWTANAMEDGFGISPAIGTTFTDEDIRQRAKVAIIGATMKEELFGSSDAIGRSFKLRGHNIRVIGVYPPSGQIMSFNMDEIAIIPYSTAQKDILGIDYYVEVFVRTDPDADIETVAEDIRATLRESHGITDAAKDDFFVWTQKDIVNRLGLITQTLTLFLVAIASISLLVGGIGIMNIMLVSVTERTHEIGLRKAVGATNSNIMRQFLAESIILTATGGLIGTGIAAALVFIITWIAQTQYQIAWPFYLPPFAILLGIGMATMVGLIFGIYPARKAALKDPIVSLRYE